MSSESLILVLVCLVIGLIVGVGVSYWLSRSKTIDLESEAIKVLTAGAVALSKMTTEDDIIAAATARKAAKMAALATLKAKVTAL